MRDEKKDDYDFEIGAYRGFRLYLSFDPFSAGLVLRGSSRYNTDIGSSGQGAITRIENLAERIPSYLTYAQRDLEEVQKQLEAARQQMGQPFIMRRTVRKSCYPDGDQHKAGVRVFAGTRK